MTRVRRVSEEFHAFLESRRRDGETLAETYRRLAGGPHPEDVAGILSSETGDSMRGRLETEHETDDERTRDLRERFE